MKRPRALLLLSLLPLLVALATRPCAARSEPGQRETLAHLATALPAPATPATQPRLEWARGAAFYEIVVRSFADSDGDGIGDLRGLTSRLDYLNDGDPSTTSDLGIEAIWLMPVFASPIRKPLLYLSERRGHGAGTGSSSLTKRPPPAAGTLA
jgi:hypothetical protein